MSSEGATDGRGDNQLEHAIGHLKEAVWGSKQGKRSASIRITVELAPPHLYEEFSTVSVGDAA